MIKMKRRTVLTGTLAAGTLAAANQTRRAQAQAANGPIRLGFIAPLSGAYAAVGKEVQIGAIVAADQVNRAGGVLGRKVEVQYRDDRLDANESVSVARGFASDGIHMLFGLPITNSVVALMPIMKELNSFLIHGGSADDRMTHELFVRNFFAIPQTNYTRQSSLTRILAENFPNVTTWTGMVPDNAMGNGAYEAFGIFLKRAYREIAKREVTILEPAKSKVGSNDFKVQLSQLMASPATGLFHTLVGADGITFFQQARSFGLDKKIQAIAENAQEMDLPKALKRAMPTNVWSLSYWNQPAYKDDKQGQEIAAVFKREFGDPIPHGLSSMGHIGLMSFVEGIKKAGSTDIDKVISALEDHRFHTVRGEAYFRKEDHQMVSNLNLVNFGPADNEAGWEVRKVLTVPDKDTINPPTPGVPVKFPT